MLAMITEGVESREGASGLRIGRERRRYCGLNFVGTGLVAMRLLLLVHSLIPEFGCPLFIEKKCLKNMLVEQE